LNDRWRKAALCAGLPTKWWFQGRGNTLEVITTKAIAYTICSLCPQHEECAKEFKSMPTNQQIGIWGGTNNPMKTKIKAKTTTLEKLFRQHQENYVSPLMQKRILDKATRDPEIESVNKWLLYELDKISRPRKPRQGKLFD